MKTDAARMNAKTRQSGVRSAMARMRATAAGKVASKRRIVPMSVACEIAKPAAAAGTASSTLSVSNWRINLARPAPSDTRIAISRRRASARAEHHVRHVGAGDREHQPEGDHERKEGQEVAVAQRDHRGGRTQNDLHPPRGAGLRPGFQTLARAATGIHPPDDAKVVRVRANRNPECERDGLDPREPGAAMPTTS